MTSVHVTNGDCFSPGITKMAPAHTADTNYTFRKMVTWSQVTWSSKDKSGHNAKCGRPNNCFFDKLPTGCVLFFHDLLIPNRSCSRQIYYFHHQHKNFLYFFSKDFVDV